jgi:hypothetical protein
MLEPVEGGSIPPGGLQFSQENSMKKEAVENARERIVSRIKGEIRGWSIGDLLDVMDVVHVRIDDVTGTELGSDIAYARISLDLNAVIDQIADRLADMP